MTPHAPPSATAIWNGRIETSRRVRSSTSEEIVVRSNSESLATKCLTVVPTPPACTPRMKPTAIRPVRNGSSDMHSKFRPPSGVRCRLTVGASNT